MWYFNRLKENRLRDSGDRVIGGSDHRVIGGKRKLIFELLHPFSGYGLNLDKQPIGVSSAVSQAIIAPEVQATRKPTSSATTMMAVALVSFASLLLELAMTRLFS